MSPSANHRSFPPAPSPLCSWKNSLLVRIRLTIPKLKTLLQSSTTLISRQSTQHHCLHHRLCTGFSVLVHRPRSNLGVTPPMRDETFCHLRVFRRKKTSAEKLIVVFKRAVGGKSAKKETLCGRCRICTPFIDMRTKDFVASLERANPDLLPVFHPHVDTLTSATISFPAKAPINVASVARPLFKALPPARTWPTSIARTHFLRSRQANGYDPNYFTHRAMTVETDDIRWHPKTLAIIRGYLSGKSKYKTLHKPARLAIARKTKQGSRLAKSFRDQLFAARDWNKADDAAHEEAELEVSTFEIAPHLLHTLGHSIASVTPTKPIRSIHTSKMPAKEARSRKALSATSTPATSPTPVRSSKLTAVAKRRQLFMKPLQQVDSTVNPVDRSSGVRRMTNSSRTAMAGAYVPPPMDSSSLLSRVPSTLNTPSSYDNISSALSSIPSTLPSFFDESSSSLSSLPSTLDTPLFFEHISRKRKSGSGSFDDEVEEMDKRRKISVGSSPPLLASLDVAAGATATMTALQHDDGTTTESELTELSEAEVDGYRAAHEAEQRSRVGNLGLPASSKP